MQCLYLHKAASTKISLINLYQENIEANGIFKKTIILRASKEKCPEIVRTNLFGFHHFVIPCGDISACTSFGHTVYILLFTFIGYVNK